MNKPLVKKQKAERLSFASTKNQLAYPDFLDIQLKSFQQFFQLETTPENREEEGLFRVFSENFPITDARNQFVLEFQDYFVEAMAFPNKTDPFPNLFAVVEPPEQKTVDAEESPRRRRRARTA
ncbi:MAG: hypothetical protein ACO2ZD_14310 [Pseudomonadales bacterium]